MNFSWGGFLPGGAGMLRGAVCGGGVVRFPLDDALHVPSAVFDAWHAAAEGGCVSLCGDGICGRAGQHGKSAGSAAGF